MKKSLIFGLGALMVSALVGLGSLISVQASEYKETRAETETINVGYWKLATNSEISNRATDYYSYGDFEIYYEADSVPYHYDLESLEQLFSRVSGVTTLRGKIKGSTNYIDIFTEHNADMNTRVWIGYWPTIRLTIKSFESDYDSEEFSSIAINFNLTEYNYLPTTSVVGSFTFANQINYYAPYSQDIDSAFVYDSTMSSSGSHTYKIIFNGWFISGGEVFNQIRLDYDSAEAMYYFDENGNRQLFSGSNFASFGSMFYVNSIANRFVLVNQRLTQSWSENGSVGVTQLKGSKWISGEYQKINFIVEPITTSIVDLTKLNNSLYQGNTYINGNNGDIGLGQAFTLIGTAFSSLTGLLSIAIFPGITLGLLLFLPLITGIIIAVIWIVKR